MSSESVLLISIENSNNLASFASGPELVVPRIKSWATPVPGQVMPFKLAESNWFGGLHVLRYSDDFMVYRVC